MSDIILTLDGQQPPEAEAPTPYDFEFICRTFNLVQNRGGAFNPTVILQIHRDANGTCVIILPDQLTVVANPEDMAEIEANIKARQADLARIRTAQIEKDATEKMNAEINAASRAVQEANMMHQLKRPGGRGRG